MIFSLPIILLIVFLANIIPAFMPPTAFVLAYFYITQGINPLILAFFGAIASTFGRIVLAKWSGPLVSKFLKSKNDEKNMEFAKETLDKRPKANFLFAFIYSLAPFPSNSLFIISGTAKIRIFPIALGFFCGRLISYFAVIQIANYTIDSIQSNLSFQNPIMIAIDLIGIIFSIWIFTIDWKKIMEKLKK